jgi:hypothetical protein
MLLFACGSKEVDVSFVRLWPQAAKDERKNKGFPPCRRQIRHGGKAVFCSGFGSFAAKTRAKRRSSSSLLPQAKQARCGTSNH